MAGSKQEELTVEQEIENILDLYAHYGATDVMNYITKAGATKRFQELINQHVRVALEEVKSKEQPYLSIHSDEDDSNQVESYAVPVSAIDDVIMRYK